MGIKVSDKGGEDFKVLDAGSHLAVCTQIIAVGPQETPWGMKEKLKVRFEVPAERVEWEKDGHKHEGPMTIWANYGASLSKNSNLRNDLETWRGREFTKEELAGFDLDNILGKACIISVTHNKADNGKTYANISGISRLLKGQEAPKPEGDLLSFDYSNFTDEQYTSLPEWLQKLVDAGIANRAELDAAKPQEQAADGPGFEDDEIPFS